MVSLADPTLPAIAIACPGPDRVLAFLSRSLSSDEHTTLERHVADCRTCKKLCVSLEQTNAEDAISTADGAALASVGRYELAQRLGRGGMGTVYAAYDPQLDRRVALKLVRPEISELGGAERLVREGRALARLSHPHVVAVYDAGVDRDRVYIVMELVDGQNLASWLAAERRDVSAIVRMFVAAGRGIAAAHRAGVMHRDVKPENVLVDRAGVAKVADFGLAGSATPVPDEERLTLPNAVMGTPAFMSPEQRRGEDVGPATDQYSLCAALDRALADARHARDALPAWLARTIARGLAPRAADRFATMDELVTALDIDARIARVRTRRRMAAAATGIGAVLLLGAFAVRSPAHDDAKVACDAASTKRTNTWTDADRNAITAALVATGKPFAVETVTRVKAAGDRYAASLARIEGHACEAAPRSESARATLNESLACLGERRDAFASVIAQLRTIDPANARYAVSLVTALPSPDDCAIPSYLAEERVAASTPLAAATRSEVTRELAQSKAAQSRGAPPEAVIHARRAVELARASGGVLLARALLGLGDVVHDTDGYPAAEAAYREAATLAETIGADHLRAASMVSLMGALARITGREKEALALQPLVEAAVTRAGQQRELAPSLRRAAGVAKLQQWQTQAAVVDLEAALASAREVIPPDDPRLTRYLFGAGLALGRVSRDQPALALMDEAVRIATDAWGAYHPETARLAINRATRRASLGRCDEALEELARVRVILTDVFPPASPEHLQIAQAMGACHFLLGHYDDALREYRARQDAMLAAGRGKTDLMAASWVDLGDIEYARKHFDAAIEHYRHGLAAHEELLGGTDGRCALPLSRIGNAELEARRPARAVAPLERALAIYTSANATGIQVAEAQLALARALGARERPRARQLAESARDAYAAAGPSKAAGRAEADAVVKSLQ